jgi:hypothetical protein
MMVDDKPPYEDKQTELAIFFAGLQESKEKRHQRLFWAARRSNF